MNGDGTGIISNTPLRYLLVMGNASGQEVFAIGYDGKVTLGPGYTTPDEASKLFWDYFGQSLEKHVKENV